MAAAIKAAHPEVGRVLLFGSFARSDSGARNDIDLRIVLRFSDLPIRDRVGDFLEHCTADPTDVFPLTVAELEARLRSRRVSSHGSCGPMR